MSLRRWKRLEKDRIFGGEDGGGVVYLYLWKYITREMRCFYDSEYKTESWESRNSLLMLHMVICVQPFLNSQLSILIYHSLAWMALDSSS